MVDCGPSQAILQAFLHQLRQQHPATLKNASFRGFVLFLFSIYFVEFCWPYAVRGWRLWMN